MITVLSLVLATLLADSAPPKPAALFTARRVRAMDAVAAHLITDGKARSLTVRRMLDRLEAGHLILLVSTTTRLSHFGETRFLGAGGDYRYAQIEIRIPGLGYDPVTWLGHELQHALEILDAPEIVDQATLKAYALKAPGMFWRGNGVVESAEAQRVTSLVDRELTLPPPPRENHD